MTATESAANIRARLEWAELRRYLQSCGAALTDEVRRYPGPIARCDEQLPKLLQQRSEIAGLLSAMDAAGHAADPEGARLAFLRAFLARSAITDDSDEAALRSRIAAALG